VRKLVALFVALLATGALAASAESMSADWQPANPPAGCQWRSPSECATWYAKYELIYGVWYCEPIAVGYCRP